MYQTHPLLKAGGGVDFATSKNKNIFQELKENLNILISHLFIVRNIFFPEKKTFSVFNDELDILFQDVCQEAQGVRLALDNIIASLDKPDNVYHKECK